MTALYVPIAEVVLHREVGLRAPGSCESMEMSAASLLILGVGASPPRIGFPGRWCSPKHGLRR